MLKQWVKSVCLSGLNVRRKGRCRGWAAFGSTVHKQNPRQHRTSATDDRRLSLIMIADEVKISKDSVSTLVHQHLGKRKIYGRFDERAEANSTETCEDFIDMCDRNPQFLETILQEMKPGDTNKIRRPSHSQWHGVHCLPRLPKKVGWQNPRLRWCRSPFSIARAWSIMNLYPRVKLWTWKFTREFWNDCCNASGGFGQNCTRVYSGISSTTTPVRILRSARSTLSLNARSLLSHPHYSPGLAPADFFLFPRFKLARKVLRFTDVADIKQRVSTVLREIQEAFADSFQQLYNWCQKSVVANGDYLEGQ